VTYIESFLQTSTLYLLGDQPCTPPASKRGPALSQSTASLSLPSSPDYIEEEFAKHRAHVRQTNDVVDDKITK
jgi:hypothetical protein